MGVPNGKTPRSTGFFAPIRHDRNLQLPLLNVEDGVRDVALREDNLVLEILGDASALAVLGRKQFSVLGLRFLDWHIGLSMSSTVAECPAHPKRRATTVNNG